MPTILIIAGWRLFFYSNEGNEPVHIHAEKAEMECKSWLNRVVFEIHEAFSYNLSPAAKREIRKIIFEHFDYIVGEWDQYFKKEVNMDEVYKIENFNIDSECITFRVNGINYSFRLDEVSPRLARASEKERNEFTISPSGYGIHWESIDEDLSIKGLIQKI